MIRNVLGFIALLGASFVTASAAESSRPPNVIVIYSDDHGWADLGVQGSDKDIRTPHLDALAREGVRFTRGYVTAPQCVPSRAGVLTGRYQQRFGVEDNNRGPLPLDQVTLAERLKSAGYATGQVGKWHLDIVGGKNGPKGARVSKDHMPHAQGFDEYFRGELRQFYASHAPDGKPFPDAPHLVTDDRFRVEVQTEAALAFLERRATRPEQPFFLYLAWYAPHVPLESPEPWFSQTPTRLPKARRQALAMIAAMDDGLGRLRARLKEMGQERNTLIFFVGDNGAPLGGAWNGSLNVPLVGQKGMLTEGGIRTPFVAAWPGRLPAGITYDKPVVSLDVAATAVALAGLPADPVLDGTNLLPYLEGKSEGTPHERLFWRWGSQAAVLEHPWKLVRLGDREELLFDVSRPDGENAARNMLSQKPEIGARLRGALKDWSETLQPPGLPSGLDPHHEGLFAEHEVIPTRLGAAKRKGAPPGSIHGWICRNGTLSTAGGFLSVTPDPNAAKNAKPFLAKSGLSLNGPLTLRVRVEAAEPTVLGVSWRTQSEGDFVPANTTRVEVPAGPSEQAVAIPAGEEVIHLRVHLGGQVAGLRFRSLVVETAGGAGDRADFEHPDR